MQPYVIRQGDYMAKLAYSLGPMLLLGTHDKNTDLPASGQTRTLSFRGRPLCAGRTFKERLMPSMYCVVGNLANIRAPAARKAVA